MAPSDDHELARLRSIGSNSDYLNELVVQLREGGIVPFIGAGLSAPDFPCWSEFLRIEARRRGIEREIEALLRDDRHEAAADALCRQGEEGFHRAIERTFDREPSAEIRGGASELPRIAHGPVVTTNYDRVLETAFDRAKASFPSVIHGVSSDAVRLAIHRNHRYLLKIHGDARERDRRILSSRDYDEHYGELTAGITPDSPQLVRLMEAIFLSSSVLFIGCSLGRDRTLGVARHAYSMLKLRHFAIMEAPITGDARRQRERYLGEHGILPIWYPHGEHGSVDLLVSYLAQRDLKTRRLVWESVNRRPAGLSPTSQVSMAVAVDSALLVELKERDARLETYADREIEAIRRLAAGGRGREAYRRARKLRDDTVQWNALAARRRAQLLRIEAFSGLTWGDGTDAARRMAKKARELDPDHDDVALRASIELEDGNLTAAVALLENASDPESRRVHAGHLLVQRQPRQALGRLDVDDPELPADADTFRLRALAHLLLHDMGAARQASQEACKRAPDDYAIRYASGVIDYLSSLVPGALPTQLLQWPEPVDATLVRSDEASKSHLSRAEETFTALLSECELTDHEQQNVEGWKVASLAAHPDRCPQAEEYCRTLLAREGVHAPALAWSLERGFAIKTDSIRVRLLDRISNGSATAIDVISLLSIQLSTERLDDALHTLDRTRGLLFSEGKADLWRIWRAQQLAISGEPEAALEQADQITDTRLRREARLKALEARSHATGQWEAMIAEVDAIDDDDVAGPHLYRICEIRARLTDWDFVASRARRLLRAMPTYDSLRLGTYAAAQTRRWQLCLDLIAQAPSLLPAEQTLHEELARLRIVARQALGEARGALMDAESLARRSPTKANLAALFSLRYGLGDRRGSLAVANQLRLLPLTPAEALHLAESIRLDDRDLGTELWRQAASSEQLDDDLIPSIHLLGLKLGVGPELAEISRRAMTLAQRGTGPIRSVTLKELLTWGQQRAEELRDRARQYAAGEIPTHRFAADLGRELSHFYHQQLIANETEGELRDDTAVFIRHAGRPFTTGTSACDLPPDTTVAVDLSGLLLAQHLGVLTKAERAFAPLYISTITVPALQEMRDRLRPQPVVEQTAEAVCTLIEEERLRRLDVPSAETESAGLSEALGQDLWNLLTESRRTGAYVVAHLPLTPMDGNETPPELPDWTRERLLDPAAPLLALGDHGELDEDEVTRLLDGLGTSRSGRIDTPIPAPGSELYLKPGLAASLVGADALELVCQYFSVRVTDSEHEEHKAGRRSVRQQREHDRWLAELIEQLHKGLRQGSYAQLKSSGSHPPPHRQADRLTISCLLDLVDADRGASHLLWIDDRLCSRPARTVGIVEILRALVARGRLTERQYFSHLDQLRSSNVRFLPLAGAELLAWLDATKTIDGELQESARLRTLRRYANSSLLSSGADEEPIAANLQTAFLAATFDVWRTTRDPDERHARLDWLVRHLHVDFLRSTPEADDQPYLARAACLAELLYRGTVLGMRDDAPAGDPALRKEYFDWLDAAFLEPWARADPSIEAAILERLRERVLTPELPETAPSDEKRVKAALIRNAYPELPERLRRAAQCAPESGAEIGLEFTPLLRIDARQFEETSFWDAVAQARRDGEAQVTPLDGEETMVLTLRRGGDGRKDVHLVAQDAADTTAIGADLTDLAGGSREEMYAALRGRLATWFDAPHPEADAAIAEIAAGSTPRERVQRWRQWTGTSADRFYSDLDAAVRQRRRLPFDDLVPPPEVDLLRHYRLHGDAVAEVPLATALGDAARQLLDDVGVEAAIDRLSVFPVPLPGALEQALRELAATAQRRYLTRLSGTARGLLSRIHALRLRVATSDLGPDEVAAIRETVRDLFDQWTPEEHTPLLQSLHWTERTFQFRPESEAWPEAVHLAMTWAHGHRLYETFRRCGAPAEWIATELSRARSHSASTFHRSLARYDDVSDPTRAYRETLLLHGLAYALGDATETVVDGELRAIIRRAICSDADGLLLLPPPLYRSPGLGRDALGSFLSGDRSTLAPLLGDDLADQLAGPALAHYVSHALSLLESKGLHEKYAWMMIAWVGIDLPLPSGDTRRLARILSQIDFADLYATDELSSAVVIRFAAHQSWRIEDGTLRTRLEEELVRLARTIATRQPGTPSDGTRRPDPMELIADAAEELAVVPDDGVATAGRFAALWRRLCSAWPALQNVSRTERLLTRLPAAEARQVWSLLVWQRSR